MNNPIVQIRRLQEVQFILWSALALNLLVALAKLGYGLISHSLGMQADGFHSLFDGVSNVVGLSGLWLASKPADLNHPYGHKKFETFATAGIGGLLVTTSLYLLWQTYQTFGQENPTQVTLVSFVVMLATMGVNVFVTTWEREKGKELQSEILIADSYHTASDLFTSLSVIVGLAAVQLGYPLLDPLVAIGIALVIAWTAITVFKEVIRTLADEIRLDEEAVRAVVLDIPEILICHDIRTRGLANHIFVDLSIHVQANMSVEDAHDLTHRVEQALKQHFPAIEDVVAHIEPQGHQ